VACDSPPCPTTPATFQVIDDFPPVAADGFILAPGKLGSVMESTQVQGIWNRITIRFHLAASLPPGAILQISGIVRHLKGKGAMFVLFLSRLL
jgi:hypothetical protein